MKTMKNSIGSSPSGVTGASVNNVLTEFLYQMSFLMQANWGFRDEMDDCIFYNRSLNTGRFFLLFFLLLQLQLHRAAVTLNSLFLGSIHYIYPCIISKCRPVHFLYMIFAKLAKSFSTFGGDGTVKAQNKKKSKKSKKR